MIHKGRSHGVCAFRGEDGEFELDYSLLGRGEVHTVYPQQDLVTDLIAEYLDRGGDIRFGVTVTGVDPHTATIRYRDANGTGEATGRFLAGCDGGNGITRTAIPEDSGRRYVQDHGVSWLAVLAEAPQSMAAVTYAIHDDGFAGHMARSPGVTRYYLQVPPGDRPETWTDERIWAALDTRLRTDEFGQLKQGAISERRIVRLRSEVVDPIQYDRLFLVGDAAGLISPSAAKGANLAIMEAEVLSRALVDAIARADERALISYSSTCLPRVWRAQEFSRWMIDLLRPLALMYGGPFYRSFAELTEAVRSGEESYSKAFGAHHFAHMAADPALSELFHGSMAASNAMFAGVTKVVDFSAARSVVDVAGGNGELLSQILHATPSLHGVLLDLPNALASAAPPAGRTGRSRHPGPRRLHPLSPGHRRHLPALTCAARLGRSAVPHDSVDVCAGHARARRTAGDRATVAKGR
jgi:p-hydroxybenzoate 3-monooxygenase